MYPIASYTVTGSSIGYITMSGIPSTFTHLQVRMFIRSDAATTFTYLGGYLNGDGGGTDYSRHGLTGSGSSASSNAVTSTGLWAVDSALSSASNTTGIFTVSIMDILDYTNTNKYKTLKITTGTDTNGGGNVWLTSNLWQSTAAVNTINFLSGGNFIAGSRFDIYGISTSNATGA
jgi:hypothetical protein